MKLSKSETVLVIAVLIICFICMHIFFLDGNGIAFSTKGNSSEPLEEYSKLENKVCINTASKEEILLVEGITPDMADAIITYRNVRPFTSFEELLLLDEIDQSALNLIKDKIIFIK